LTVCFANTELKNYESGGLNPLTFLLWVRQCFGRFLKTVSDGTAMTVTFCGGVHGPRELKTLRKLGRRR